MKQLITEMKRKFENTKPATKQKEPRRWQDNDGDRVWYEPGVDVKEESVNEAYYSSNPIETLVGLFGYRQGIEEFLNDNPGAVDALIEWILSIKDFRDQIKNEFSKEEAENMGIYDLEYDDLDEQSVTGGIAGYQTPYAFSKDKKVKKKMKYPGVAEAMEKRYEHLIEGYRTYATSDPKKSPETKVNETIIEVSKKLREIEESVKNASRLKEESGVTREGYKKRTNKALGTISERLVKISERVRNLMQ